MSTRKVNTTTQRNRRQRRSYRPAPNPRPARAPLRAPRRGRRRTRTNGVRGRIGGNLVTLSGVERVLEVFGDKDEPNYDCITLNPVFWNDNRLALQSRLYQNYRYEDIEYEFVSSKTPLTSGTIAVGLVQNKSTTITAPILMSAPGGKSERVGESFSRRIDIKDLQYPAKGGFAPTAPEGLDTMPVNLWYACTCSDADVTGRYCGYINIRYRITLSNPSSSIRRFYNKHCTLDELRQLVDANRSVSFANVTNDIEKAESLRATPNGVVLDTLLRVGRALLGQITDGALTFISGGLAGLFGGPAAQALISANSDETECVHVFGEFPGDPSEPATDLELISPTGRFTVLTGPVQNPTPGYFLFPSGRLVYFRSPPSIGQGTIATLSSTVDESVQRTISFSFASSTVSLQYENKATNYTPEILLTPGQLAIFKEAHPEIPSSFYTLNAPELIDAPPSSSSFFIRRHGDQILPTVLKETDGENWAGDGMPIGQGPAIYVEPYGLDSYQFGATNKPTSIEEPAHPAGWWLEFPSNVSVSTDIPTFYVNGRIRWQPSPTVLTWTLEELKELGITFMDI